MWPNWAGVTPVSAHCAAVAHRRPIKTHLVGVGVEAEAVLGIAVAAFEGEILRERGMAGERQAHFRERFFHVEAAGDRQRRTAAAGRGALLREEIREEI